MGKRNRKSTKSSYKINDYHYRFDGSFKQTKKKTTYTPTETIVSSEDVHDIAVNVFGKTHYISICDI